MENAARNTNHAFKEISNWIAIGILFAINVNNLSFLINNLIREMFMYFSVSPVLNFWITEIIAMLLVIRISVIFFNFLKRCDREKLAKTINFLLVLFFLIATLKYLFQNYFILFLPDNVLHEMKVYNREIINVKMYGLLFFLFECLTYLIIVFFLMRKKGGKDLQDSIA